MPSRPMIAAIVMLWLGVAGWYVAREIAPRWGLEDVPPFHIDLTDEVGRPSIDWDVSSRGKDVGSITTKVRRLDAHTFELSGVFRSTQLQIFWLSINRVTVEYKVTPEGKLLEADMELKARPAFGVDVKELDILLGVKGKVEEGVWKPAFFLGGAEVPVPGIEGFKLPPGGGILNTMLPLNRIPGLAEGRRWSIPMMDPVGDVQSWIGKDMALRELQAEVSSDTLTWHKQEAPCFKIDYREPGRPRVKARTWVRRSDGLVLRQEAYHDELDLIMVRRSSGLFD